jgi:TRAP-type transport system small permease protein
MRKLNDWLQKAEIFICVFLMTITFIIILAHITGRYVFHYPFFFAEEISRYCFIFTIMIGASLGLRRNIHTRVVYFISFLSPRATRILNILRGLCIMGFLAAIIYYGILLARKTMTIPTAAMEWPWGLIYLAAPLGAALMMLTTVFQIVDDIQYLTQDSQE